MNALIAASVHSHAKIVTLLVGNHEKVRKDFIIVIVREIQRNARKTQEVFLNAGALTSVFGESRAEGIDVAEDVVEAAARNWRNDKEVMTLLLDRRGADIHITGKVVAAIARGFDKDVIALLFDRREAGIQITEEVVKAAAGNSRNGEEVMTLLLDRRGDDVQITEEVVKAD